MTKSCDLGRVDLLDILDSLTFVRALDIVQPQTLGETPFATRVGLAAPLGYFLVPLILGRPINPCFCNGVTVFLLYLDESGVPESHADQTSHFVVVGLAVHEGTWFALEKQVAGLKRRFGLQGDSEYELHAGWILQRYRDQEEVEQFESLSLQARFDAVQQVRQAKLENLKERSSKSRTRKLAAFRKTEPFIHLTAVERRQLVAETLRIVAKYRRGLCLFGEAINKTTLSPAVDPWEECFDHLVTRFEKFLKTRKRKTWGLIAADHYDTQAKLLPARLARFQRTGTRWADIERVIESPFFVDSRGCSGVQLADLCAFALRRYLENEEEDNFRLILPKFFRSRGQLVGLRHFTKAGCPCLICRERQHD